MATTIKLKNSVTTTNAPSSLAQGEVAINITDKKVWVGNAATTPIQLLGGGADGNFTNISVSSVATFGAGTVSAPSITTSGDTNTGIFFPAADTIAFTEGGAEAMRIDSNGDVGIGTTNPLAKFEVHGQSRFAASGSSAVLILEADATSTNGVDIQSTYYGGAGYGPMKFTTSGSERMRITSAGDVGIGTTSPASQLSISQGTGGNNLNVRSRAYFGGTHSSDSLVLGYSVKADPATTDRMIGTETNSGGGAPAAILMNSGVMQFHTATSVTSGAAFSSERMRITSGGNVLIGKSSDNDTTLGVRVTSGIVNSAGSSDFWNSYSTTAGVYRFYVTSGGTVTATNTTISAISDQRFKENIVDLDVGLDAVMALKPRKFDWKEGKGKDIKGDRGFIAQEFEQVFPDLIDEWKDPAPKGEEPYKAVRQDLIPVLVKAIQELNAKVEAQAAEIALLKSK